MSKSPNDSSENHFSEGTAKAVSVSESSEVDDSRGYGPTHVEEERSKELAERSRDKPLGKDDVTVVDKPLVKKAVTAASLGNCMEWFDMGVFGFLAAGVTEQVFYGESDWARVGVFGTLALGFVIRPFGGIFFGFLGDKIGRQKVLAITMLLMSLGTFLIGCLPSYDSIGIWAAVGLLACRFLQSFSTGGEYAGATTFIAEYAPDRKRAFLGSWLDFGTYAGFALGSGFVTLLTATLGMEKMVEFGWRIPFWIALPMGMVGLYIRSKLEDSPAFKEEQEKSEKRQQANESSSRLKEIFTTHRRAFLVCLGLVVSFNVLVYVLTSYMPSYFTGVTEFSANRANMLVLYACVLIVASINMFGRLSDRVGRRVLILSAAIAQLVLAYPVFLLFRMDNLFAQIAGVTILGVILACFAAQQAASLPALFPTNVRFSALSIAFNIGICIFCGTIPLIADAAFTGLNGKVSDNISMMIPAFMLIGASVLCLVCLRFVNESALQPLEGSKVQVDDESEIEEILRESRDHHHRINGKKSHRGARLRRAVKRK